LVPLRNKKGYFLRTLLVSELKQIQGFPASFTVLGTKKRYDYPNWKCSSTPTYNKNSQRDMPKRDCISLLNSTPALRAVQIGYWLLVIGY